MPCNQCGDCSYSSASTATLSVKITSGGLAPCEPDQEILHANIPYYGPGDWRRKLSNGEVISAQSLCVSGKWNWNAPVSPPPIGPQCPELAVNGDTTQVSRNDCGGYEAITTTTYLGGAWTNTHVTITVNNNAECE